MPCFLESPRPYDLCLSHTELTSVIIYLCSDTSLPLRTWHTILMVLLNRISGQILTSLCDIFFQAASSNMVFLWLWSKAMCYVSEMPSSTHLKLPFLYKKKIILTTLVTCCGRPEAFSTHSWWREFWNGSKSCLLISFKPRDLINSSQRQNRHKARDRWPAEISWGWLLDSQCTSWENLRAPR